jgi:hypothetical protein
MGRSDELAILLRALEPDGSSVVHVHGVAGIGKTTLLKAFGELARERGATVVALDSRALEPTDRGLLAAVARALGIRATSLERIGARLAESPGGVLLILDHYEHLRLLDTWIRQELVPALPSNVRVVIGSRTPPVAAWLTASELSEVVGLLPLGPLPAADAENLLIVLGVPADAARSVNRLTRGHPLAIRLAARTAEERPDLRIADVGSHRVIEELSRLYLSDVPDPETRRALEAASVVRRVTASLMAAILPDLNPQAQLARLRELPFVEVRHDGLSLHEAVQGALGSLLESTDPARYREYRRRAWHVLRDEVRDVGPDELWRYTADMLYLIENPVLREAFFPSGAPSLAVEPAVAGDLSSIERIAVRHDGEASRQLLRDWWVAAPSAFSAVRDRDGLVAGFSILLDHVTMLSRSGPDDPVVAGWRRHLAASPLPSGQLVLGFRRWLDVEHGELPCASQAAAWLDVKRTYMELRPNLRRIYTVVEKPDVYLPVVTRLGFRPVGPEDGVAGVGDRMFTSVVLDFGPSSVDGWLAGLVAAELGLDADVVFDADAREAYLDGTRLALTDLESRLLASLQQRRGKAVSRATLLDEVWGYEDDYSSNVVDVVVRRLRQKLGERAAALETVRGVGYRWGS